jgi:hypothetical protein
MSATLPSIRAIVATKGRAEVVVRLVPYLREQTLPPDVLVVSACDPSDVTGIAKTILPIASSSDRLDRRRKELMDRLPCPPISIS